MTKKISEIYTEYKIMPSLQRHMFRVAAVASLICDNFTEPLLKEEIVTACLLHDMGNIIKSDLEYFPEFLQPEGLEYWQKVKDEYIKKYGDNEEEANEKIAQELVVSPNVVFLTSQDRFSLLCQHRDSDDMNVKIMHYADTRVGPYGVLSYDERMNEAKKRYKNRKDIPKEEERQRLAACGKEIEKQIFAKCKIKPEDINDETVASVILSLKDFVIK